MLSSHFGKPLDYLRGRHSPDVGDADPGSRGLRKSSANDNDPERDDELSAALQAELRLAVHRICQGTTGNFEYSPGRKLDLSSICHEHPDRRVVSIHGVVGKLLGSAERCSLFWGQQRQCCSVGYRLWRRSQRYYRDRADGIQLFQQSRRPEALDDDTADPDHGWLGYAGRWIEHRLRHGCADFHSIDFN